MDFPCVESAADLREARWLGFPEAGRVKLPICLISILVDVLVAGVDSSEFLPQQVFVVAAVDERVDLADGVAAQAKALEVFVIFIWWLLIRDQVGRNEEQLFELFGI